MESTYNWYWLVDELMEKGHRVHLANNVTIGNLKDVRSKRIPKRVKIGATL